MARFERRLRNLEARLTDCSGLLPHTTAWWDYWMAMVGKLIGGNKLDELIPLEFIDENSQQWRTLHTHILQIDAKAEAVTPST
jgi:hypothetical protein